jgi:hypothetical protein
MMTAWITLCPGLLRRYPKTKSIPNLMNPLFPPNQCAIFAEKDSMLHESGTDILNHTSRIQFIAHSRIVPGQAVVGLT